MRFRARPNPITPNDEFLALILDELEVQRQVLSDIRAQLAVAHDKPGAADVDPPGGGAEVRLTEPEPAPPRPPDPKPAARKPANTRRAHTRET